MERLIEIINLFFIPIISIYIYLNITEGELKFNFKNFSIYAINVVFILTITKGVIAIASYLFSYEKKIVVGSSTYSIIAILISIIIPFIMKNIKILHKKD